MNDNMTSLNGELDQVFENGEYDPMAGLKGAADGGNEDLELTDDFNLGSDFDSDPFEEEDEASEAQESTPPASDPPAPPAAKEKAEKPPEEEAPTAPVQTAEDDSEVPSSPKVQEIPIGKAVAEAAQSGNPFAAIMATQKEQGDMEKTKQEQTDVFEQPAIFRFEGKESEIENPELSFDQLRIQMADKFVILDEGKKVSWSISYGKTKKAILDVAKSIRSERERIEASADFLVNLKKTKDKSAVRCYVEPFVRTPGKGTASCNVAAVLSAQEAETNPAGICIIPNRNGKVLELRKTGAGRFITPVQGKSYLPEVEAGFYPAFPPVPYPVLTQIISFFRSLMKKGQELEALVYLYWDKLDSVYRVIVPRQKVTKTSVTGCIQAEDLLTPERFVHVMDIHSHNSMEAEFSEIDDQNELETRVYAVIGELQNLFPTIRARISNNGQFLPIPLGQVFALPEEGHPPHWHASLTCVHGEGAA